MPKNMQFQGLRIFYISTGDKIKNRGKTMWGQITNIGLANLPYWNFLPMMYTNFGGDIQLSTIEPYNNNPLNAVLNPMAQMSWGIAGLSEGFSMFPQVNQGSASALAQQWLTPTYNQMASQNINTTDANIKGTITRLEAKLQDKSTTEEQKTEIQKIIDNLKQAQEKLDNLKKSSELTPDEAYKQSTEISSEVNEIIKNAVNLFSSAQTAQTQNSENKTNQAENKPAATNPQKTETKTDDSEKKTDKKQGVSQNIDDFSTEIKKDVEAFFNAIDGIGTDNDEMEKLIQKHVDAGTLTEFMLCWNEKASNRHNESLIEAFMNDADHGQAKKYLPLMIESLTERAKELGIYNEQFESYRNAADKEVFSDGIWGALHGMNDDVVCENIDAMLQLIAEKEGSKYGSKKTE